VGFCWQLPLHEFDLAGLCCAVVFFFKVPDELSRHVVSSKKAQANWYAISLLFFFLFCFISSICAPAGAIVVARASINGVEEGTLS